MTFHLPAWPGLTREQQEKATNLANEAVRVAQEGGDVDAWLREWCTRQPDANSVDTSHDAAAGRPE